MCGEHYSTANETIPEAGSSPRVRGTPYVALQYECGGGIIPACAGNTSPPTKRTVRARGSSPRVRGTHLLICDCARVRGIIPACAGNTVREILGRADRRDHPRVCGEHDCDIAQLVHAVGSSPRVRGTLPAFGHGLRPLGIIPACAGNTWNRQRQASPCWDHPRVCGEHSDTVSRSLVIQGSSPRVRGTPTKPMVYNEGMGIIPACAGNTLIPHGKAIMTGDHPRVCGEHIAGVRSIHRGWGSSPRVRGTRLGQFHVVADAGIIPACAGNTGNHLADTLFKSGSSPRVRGTHRPKASTRRWPGIIPACAGNTMASLIALKDSGDHPRVCGEHKSRSLTADVSPGSSPRVRGTPKWPWRCRTAAGIIPACAGNTPQGRTARTWCRDHPRVCGEHWC